MTGAVGGGNTNWFVAIQQILSRLESMGPESAAADAQALAQAISAAHEAAQHLYRFGGDGLQGVAASSSEDAARQISSDIVSAAANAQPGIDALVNAQSVLLASQAQRGSLMELQGELLNPLGDAFGAMTRAGLLMTETYNGPMSSAGDGLGLAGTTGADGLLAGTGAGGSAGGAGSSGGSSAAARSSAAAATDLGDYGSQSAKQPTAPPSGGTSADPVPQADSAKAGDSPLSLGEGSGNGGGGGDGPDSLTRGGLGSPDSSSSTVSPAAMMMPGSAAAGAGGAKLAGSGGAGGSSAGGSSGSSGANPAALSRRLSAAVPTAAPTSGTSATTTPVGAGPSRAGAAPMGAPHGGGRGRGSNDTEHKSAHYLHTTDNGAEIVGTLPLVGPPVIGDWAPPQPVTPATSDDAASSSEPDDNPDRDLKL